LDLIHSLLRDPSPWPSPSPTTGLRPVWSHPPHLLERDHRSPYIPIPKSTGSPDPPSSEDAMESRAKLLGHPVHPMLIVFPLGLLATSVGFDITYLITRNGGWGTISYWLIGVGIVMGLVAAIFGLIDWLAIPPRTRAKRIGAYHGIGNA